MEPYKQLYYNILIYRTPLKKITFLLLCTFVATLAFAQDAVVSNQTLLDLKNAGFSEEVILAKIKTESVRFDTSTEALLALKKAVFSDVILTAVMEKNQMDKKPLVDDETALKAKELNLVYPTSIEEVDGKLVITGVYADEKYYLGKGDMLKVNLPIAKDFQFIRKKQGLFSLKNIGKIADAVSLGVVAVTLGTGTFSTSALDVFRGATAVRFGSDALNNINELNISKNAKKIAGKSMKIIGWGTDSEAFVIRTELDGSEYVVELGNALISGEVKIK